MNTTEKIAIVNAGFNNLGLKKIVDDEGRSEENINDIYQEYTKLEKDSELMNDIKKVTQDSIMLKKMNFLRRFEICFKLGVLNQFCDS